MPPPAAVSQIGVVPEQSEFIRQPTHRLFAVSQTIAPASAQSALVKQPGPQVLAIRPFMRHTGPAALPEQSALEVHSTQVLLALQCDAPPSPVQSELV